jgi:hypothetical protein
MPVSVADVRANLNENILHAVAIIGKSRDRRRVFEAIYRGQKKLKTVDDIVRETGLSRVRVLQEAGKLYANQIVEKTKKDNQTAYKKDETYTHHKKKVLSILDKPQKAKKLPTKQRPHVTSNTYKINVLGKKPKITALTVDDVDSFHEVRRLSNIDSSLSLEKIPEQEIKAGLQKIIGETHIFKDWGGEKNDLFTNKLWLKGKRRTAAFALKGRGTKGTLTPAKMGKNGDQIARLVGSAAEVFFIVYHGKVDESVIAQLEAFCLGKSLSGRAIWYGVIDGDDLNRLYQAYPAKFGLTKRGQGN